MPIPDFLGLTRLAKPLTSEEGHRILERDHYRCQYCGLTVSNFENSLIMTVDFSPSPGTKGKVPNNLITACRPCNIIKGRRVYAQHRGAKAYVRSALWNSRDLGGQHRPHAKSIRSRSP
jgi:5-methylcytosine-specific restriction endonuclease McrA